MADAKKKIRVALSPALIKKEDLKESIVVVIDILRATTSMCVAFDFGVESIIPVQTLEECYAYKEKGYLVAAERNAVPVEGFDFGNSPFAFMTPLLKGKTLVMSTTNGTRAIYASKGAIEILIGAFANQSLLIDYLRFRNENIILVCSGWKYEINIEDTIFAGAVVYDLQPYFQLGNDAAMIAMALYKEADVRKSYFLRNSVHFHRLIERDLQPDVKYCLRRDTHPVLPYLKDDRLVLKSYEPQYLCLNKLLY